MLLAISHNPSGLLEWIWAIVVLGVVPLAIVAVVVLALVRASRRRRA